MPILPVEGSQITIVTKDNELMQMKVYALGGSPDFSIFASNSASFYAQYAQVYPVDEGHSWCRGWEGPDVDALKAAKALR